MNELRKIIFGFILISCLPFYAHAVVKKAGDSNYAKGILEPTSICDLSTGYGAKVDSDGNLQVEVAGGITGTFTASNVTVSEITPGTTAALLGKAEDAAHGSGDTGVAVLAVRSDSAAVTGATDGDYAAFIVGAAGHLWVEQKGTVTEDAAASAGGTGLYAFGVRSDALAATAGHDGDNANFQVGAAGAVYVMGDSIEDVAASAAGYGFSVFGVRTDTLASSSGTTGDHSWFNLSARGGLYVTGDRPEDSAHTSADYLMPVATVRNDVLSALATTDKDYAVIQTGAEGAVFVMGDQVEDTASTTADYLMPIAAVRDDWPLAAKCGTALDYGVISIDDTGGVYTHDLATKPEDSAHTSAEAGAFVMAVRNDVLGAAGAIAGTDGDYAPFSVNALGALYTVGNVAEDAAMTSGEMLNPIAAIVSTTLGTAGQVAGTAGDYAMITVDARGALYVKGDRVEDAAHTTADYILPIATQRLDVAASSAGTTADYATLNTNSVGAVYVSERYANPTCKATQGDLVTGGQTVVASGGGALKARVYKITVLTLAAEVITVTELAGFTKIYTAAGIPVTFDFGFNGILQTTAATVINMTSADASAAQITVEYSYE